jgi:hypothetical protein
VGNAETTPEGTLCEFHNMVLPDSGRNKLFLGWKVGQCSSIRFMMHVTFQTPFPIASHSFRFTTYAYCSEPWQYHLPKLPTAAALVRDQVMWDLCWTKWHWGRLFFEYFGYPCQFSFHRLLNTHHISSGASTVADIVADVSSELTREWSDPTCRNLPWFFFHCKSTHNKVHWQNSSC